MKQSLVRTGHPIAGGVAFFTIALFWISTVSSELFGAPSTVVLVKTSIPWGFLLLIPALMGTAISGTILAAGSAGGLIGSKAKRMPFIAANGILVLIPSALFLASKAKEGTFDTAFYCVQVLELAAGALNLTLLGWSMRDGLRSARWRKGGLAHPVVETEVSFLRSEPLGHGVAAFYLEKPVGFKFAPGQAIYLTLPESFGTKEGGRRRVFSIANGPDESELMIATRRGVSGFKLALWNLEKGTPIHLEGPYGTLRLGTPRPTRCVFLAGGIGITPFRSMLKDASKQDSSSTFTLFYGNADPESAAFLNEFEQLASDSDSFTLHTVMANAGSAWDGHTGRISVELLEEELGFLEHTDFYIAGPPAMVTGLRQALAARNVATKHIHSEGFPGY